MTQYRTEIYKLIIMWFTDRILALHTHVSMDSMYLFFHIKNACSHDFFYQIQDIHTTDLNLETYHIQSVDGQSIWLMVGNEKPIQHIIVLI